MGANTAERALRCFCRDSVVFLCLLLRLVVNTSRNVSASEIVARQTVCRLQWWQLWGANSSMQNEEDVEGVLGERRCCRYAFATVGSIGMASGDNVQLDGISSFAAAMLSWCVAARATLTLDPNRMMAVRVSCECVLRTCFDRMRCVHLNETTMSEGVASQHRTFYTAHHWSAVRNAESPNGARSIGCRDSWICALRISFMCHAASASELCPSSDGPDDCVWLIDKCVCVCVCVCSMFVAS